MKKKKSKDVLNVEKKKIEGVGIVSECLPGAKFKILLDEEVFNKKDHNIVATISNGIRGNNVRILPGDRVTVEMSLYDLFKGRIIFREKF
jgi:translation initiation factor IF-1